jgi:membrane protease YdiL (CAAX protease family)
MKRLISSFCLASLFGTQIADFHDLPPPKTIYNYRNPYTAGAISIIPGLGHLYLGDLQTASTLATTYLVTLHYLNSNMAQQVPFYAIYAAYRDARIYNRSKVSLYPTDSFNDLTLASFNYKILKKPEVWAGYLGFLAAGLTVGYFAFPKSAIQPSLSFHSTDLIPLTAFPIGIGEESFFRGFLQPTLTEFTNPAAGIALSSLLFGAAHIPNVANEPWEVRWRYYTFIVPLLSAGGAYFGWLTHKNHSLQEAVAVHAWYDFTLFAMSSLATHSIGAGPSQFALSIPF